MKKLRMAKAAMEELHATHALATPRGNSSGGACVNFSLSNVGPRSLTIGESKSTVILHRTTVMEERNLAKNHATYFAGQFAASVARAAVSPSIGTVPRTMLPASDTSIASSLCDSHCPLARAAASGGSSKVTPGGTT